MQCTILFSFISPSLQVADILNKSFIILLFFKKCFLKSHIIHIGTHTNNIMISLNYFLTLSKVSIWGCVYACFACSVQFSSVMSDSLKPHGLWHARLPCSSPAPGAYSNSYPSCWWCHPIISSSLHLIQPCYAYSLLEFFCLLTFYY